MEKSHARAWDLPSSLIMLVAVLLSAWRLQSADWTEGLEQIPNVAMIALGVGLALGYSRYQKRGAVFFALAYMAVIVAWQLMGAIEFAKDQTYLLDRLAILFGRLLTDVNELFAGRAVEDQFFVVALMCIPYWFISLYSGFHLTRHADYLKTILPNAILMFIVDAYHYTSKDYSWMFGVYLFLALILLGRFKYLSDRRKWVENRVQVSSESGLDLTNTTLTIALALILLAWGIPYSLPATPDGVEIWRKAYNKIFPPERFENLFASVDKEGQARPRNFMTELSLGTNTPQSDLVIFRVYVPGPAADLPRLYWRGQVYDRYEGGRWYTTADKETRRKSLDTDIKITDSDDNNRMTFTFDIVGDRQIIVYSPAQPVWVNRDVLALYSEIPSENSNEPFFDVMAIRTTIPLETGDLYRVRASIANPTITELREAGRAYPDWVRENYLQLPVDFSPRIRDLADEIANPYDNPFDKALAVTDYLRSEIEYSGVVYPPDEETDPLEYFLFDAKKGFCNYYATAEVLMLRSLGIPARIAVGYAQGEPNAQNSIYLVRERDLHAWPEVYFPGYGWVEFEPTGNQNPLSRPVRREESTVAAPSLNPVVPQIRLDEEEQITPDRTEQTDTQSGTWRDTLASALPWLVGAACFLLAALLKKRYAPDITAANMLRRAIERSGWTPPQWLSRWLTFINRTAIERHFHAINISLRWMKRPQPFHVTAYERAQVLKRLLPDASASIEALLDEHHAQMFTPRGGSEARARRAARVILYKTLQKRLKIAILGYNYAEVQ